ncbi:MAG TPA: hypothetical protein VK760_02695, partial [Candidatus Acidoferrales bacterium]|nr:hypothetical protein [Candidatus Acidoferrales bacterium]
AADRIAGVQTAIRLGLLSISAVAGCTIAWLVHLPIGMGFSLIFVGMIVARVANARVARAQMLR